MPLWPTPSHPGARKVRPSRILPAVATAAPPVIPPGTLDFPQVITEIAFDDGPLVASPTWTDVSADVRHLTITPSSRSAELGRFVTGTLSARLNNDHGDYDPTNTGSIYAPNVLPMLQIRTRMNYNGVEYPKFRGFIERLPPTIIGIENAEVTFDCTDAFAWLANINIAEPLFSEETAGQRIIDLLTDPAVDWPSALYSVRTTSEQAIVAEIDEPEGSINVLEAMQQAADSELGDLYVDQSGIITFRDRRQKLEAITSAPSAVFGDDLTASELPYTGLQPAYDIQQIINHAVVSLPDWEPSEFEDATSINDLYGRRTSTLDTILVEPEEADTIANLLVWRHKDARLLFESMTVRPAGLPFSATALWVAVLAAGVGTVWEVNWRPPGPDVTETVIVNGLSHDVGPGVKWNSSTFGVFQPDPTIDFFTIEDNTLGLIEGDGVIGY